MRSGGRFSSFLSASLIALLLGACALGPPRPLPPIVGVVWQPHNGATAPQGHWERLGVRQLLVQWTVVEQQAFVKDTDLTEVPVLPDWARIAHEPWAAGVIMGLAGRFDETVARADIAALAQTSAHLATVIKSNTPLNISGWYFPVEVDPTWADAPRLAALLAPLPRPLWISVYDTANVGADTLADSLLTWLPADVGVFFQDGVGVHARDASVARHYADTLAARLGPQRVRLIAEVFRPAVGGGFRPATPKEIRLQLSEYGSHSIFLFDGPNYLPDSTVNALAPKP